MGNIRYQRTAHRITSAVNCRPLKPSPRSICPAAPYPTRVHIPGIPPPAKFATEPNIPRIRCKVWTGAGRTLPAAVEDADAAYPGLAGVGIPSTAVASDSTVWELAFVS